MLKKLQSSKQKGDFGLAKAIAYFAGNGRTVCIPLTDSQPYDLIVDNGLVLCRVQVKTTCQKEKSGSWKVCLYSSSLRAGGAVRLKKFSPDTCDAVFVLTDDGSEYLIPAECIKVAQTLSLDNKYAAFRVTEGRVR